MTYEEFRQDRSNNAGIDNLDALRLINCLPKVYQYSHSFWAWVWILSIPSFICVSIFWKWWVGLLLLLFITPMIYSGTKKTAAQFVLEYAQENQEFFNMLVENNLLIFRKKDNQNNL